MLCKNDTKREIRFKIDSRPDVPSRHYVVAPGQAVEIDDGYCQPYQSRPGHTAKPIICQIAPGMVPMPGHYAAGMAPISKGRKKAQRAEDEIFELRETVRQLAEANAALNQRLDQVIAGGGAPAPAPADPEEAPSIDPEDDPELADDDDEEEVDPVVAELVPKLAALKKDQLLAVAAEAGVSVDGGMKKADVVDVIATAVASGLATVNLEALD